MIIILKVIGIIMLGLVVFLIICNIGMSIYRYFFPLLYCYNCKYYKGNISSECNYTFETSIDSYISPNLTTKHHNTMRVSNRNNRCEDYIPAVQKGE
jgi:hypothetical protein